MNREDQHCSYPEISVLDGASKTQADLSKINSDIQGVR